MVDRKARFLTDGEKALARSVYADAIDLDAVEIRRRKWWPFQGRAYVMAPRGHIHFHPHADCYCADFATADLPGRGLFIHELAHVWQHQRGIFLPVARHPFCRYAYEIVPDRPLARYGIEQQAEIVRHAYLLRQGYRLPEKPERAVYDALLAQAFG